MLPIKSWRRLFGVIGSFLPVMAGTVVLAPAAIAAVVPHRACEGADVKDVIEFTIAGTPGDPPAFQIGTASKIEMDFIPSREGTILDVVIVGKYLSRVVLQEPIDVDDEEVIGGRYHSFMFDFVPPSNSPTGVPIALSFTVFIESEVPQAYCAEIPATISR